MNIDTTIQRRTWIRTEDSAVEIEGDVELVKAARGAPYLTGTIRTVRGSLTVADKIFKVTRGEIEFTGGSHINPTLDIAAQYTVPNYQVTALLTGTADKPVLSLSSVPSLPQSDILAVLMFGKPANQLNAGEQQGLQQQAATMAAGVATSQIGKAAAQALGLQDLGVTTSAGGVGVGHYIGNNVYVSGSQATTSGQGQQGSVSLYLTPDLRLDTSASTNAQVGNQIELKWHKEY